MCMLNVASVFKEPEAGDSLPCLHIRIIWGALESPSVQASPSTIQSESLEVEPRYQYFVKAPHSAAKVENHCSDYTSGAVGKLSNENSENQGCVCRPQ